MGESSESLQKETRRGEKGCQKASARSVPASCDRARSDRIFDLRGVTRGKAK